MRFRMIEREGDLYTVSLLLDGEEEALLTPPHQGREAGIAALQVLVERMLQPGAVVLQDGDAFSFAIVDAQGVELARSPTLATASARDALRDRVLAEAESSEDYEVTSVSSATGTVITPGKRVWAPAIDILTRYDFSLKPTRKGPGVEQLTRESDGLHYFLLVGKRKRVLLYSRDYPTPGARAKGVKGVLKCASDEVRIHKLGADDEWRFVVHARNGREIARSGSFSSAKTRDNAVAETLALAATEQKGLKKKKASKPRKAAHKYDMSRASASGAVGVECFKRADDKRFYFHVNDERGEALLYSQGYTSKRARDNGVKAIIKNGALEDRYRVDGGQFAVRAGNRQEVARSRVFADEGELKAAMRWLRGAVFSWAGAWGVALPVEPAVTETFSLRRGSQPVGAGEAVEQTTEETVEQPVIEAPILIDEPTEHDEEMTYDLVSVFDESTAEEPTEAPDEEDTTHAVPAAFPLISEEEQSPAVTPAPEHGFEGVEAGFFKGEGGQDDEDDSDEATAPDRPPIAAVASIAGLAAGAAIAETSNPTGVSEATPKPTPRPAPTPHAASDGAAQGRSPWLLSLTVAVAAAIVVLLLFLLSREVGKETAHGRSEAVPTATANASASAASAASVSAASVSVDSASAASADGGTGSGDAALLAAAADDGEEEEDGSARDEAAPLGPDAAALGLTPGGFAAQLADYLADPDASAPRTFSTEMMRFPKNSCHTAIEAYAHIDEMVVVLAAYPKAKLAFHGHISGDEEDSFTLDDGEVLPLSLVRGRCMFRKLSERGVQESRMSFKGYGNKNPRVKEGVAGWEAANRRMEVVVTAR